MKAELRPGVHTALGQQVAVEVWWEGKMIGVVYGADGPGIRFCSKHEIMAVTGLAGAMVVEVWVQPETINSEAKRLGLVP